MALTNAEKQARYRARRDSWPRTDAQMRKLLSIAYWLGRCEENEKRNTQIDWPNVEERILEAYVKQEALIQEAEDYANDLAQLKMDYNE